MPPKTDVFADLFSSASGVKSKPKLSQMETTQQSQSSTSTSLGSRAPPSNGLFDLDALTNHGSANSSNSRVSSPFDNFDIMKPQRSGSSAAKLSTSTNIVNTAPLAAKPINEDPFDIFNKQQPVQDSYHNETASKPNTEINLLDDDFVDAFQTPSKPLQSSQPSAKSDSAQSIKTNASSASSNRKESHSKSYTNSSSFNSRKSPSLDPGKSQVNANFDHIIAELVEIGFTPEMANEAVQAVGPNVQKCVNFIMNGGVKKSNQYQNSNSNKVANDINSLANDLFSKASIFINKSKSTVMKNIEQLQQPKGDANNPTWMRNQSKYMDWLPEGEAKGSASAEEMKSHLDNERPSARNFKESGSYSNSKLPNEKKHSDLNNNTRCAHQNIRDSSDILGIDKAQEINSQSSQNKVQEDVSIVKGTSSGILKEPEVDLLGLNKKTEQALDQFLQTDYDKFKSKATESFSNGDYDLALVNYKKCLDILPSSYELRIVIFSNLAITCIKIGDYKQAKLYCESGLSMLTPEMVKDPNYVIQDKPAKLWYVRLYSRKAESLEQLEQYKDSLDAYMILIKLGAANEKVLNGKRRVEKIVNPPQTSASTAKSQSSHARNSGNHVSTKPNKSVPSKSSSVTEKTKFVRDRFEQQKSEEESKFKLHDNIQGKIDNWSLGKENNLRALLVSLPDIIPSHLNFPFLSKKITVNDIMLTKKVKMTYMKVISAIHPDKLGNLELGDKMICQGVFIILNKAWDTFRENEMK